MLPSPLLKSIPASDIFGGEADYVLTLPKHLDIAGLQYTLNAPVGIRGIVETATTLIIPKELANQFDLKYELNKEQSVVPPMFANKQIPVIEDPVKELNSLLSGDIENSALQTFIEQSLDKFIDFIGDFLPESAVLPKTASLNDKKLFIKEKLQELQQYDTFKYRVPFVVYLADFIVNAPDGTTKSSILALLSEFKDSTFLSTYKSFAKNYEKLLLRLYLGALSKIAGNHLVFDDLGRGLGEELQKVLDEGVVEIHALINGSESVIISFSDALELLESFEVIVKGKQVVVKSISDILFTSLKVVSSDDDIVLEITEDVVIKRNAALPFIGLLVNENKVIVPTWIKNSVSVTSIFDSRQLVDSKRLGTIKKGKTSTPVYFSALVPRHYMGKDKVQSLYPSVISTTKLNPSSQVNLSKKRIDLKDKVLEILQKQYINWKDTKILLKYTSNLVKTPVLSMVNIESIFSPPNRSFVIEYIKENGFVLTPLGYNLSAQIATVLKTNNLDVNPVDTQIFLPRQIFSAIYARNNNRHIADLMPVQAILASIPSILGATAVRASIPKEEIQGLAKQNISDSLPYTSAMVEYKINENSRLLLNIGSSAQIDQARAVLYLTKVDGITHVVPIIIYQSEVIPTVTNGIQFVDSVSKLLIKLNLFPIVLHQSVMVPLYIPSPLHIGIHLSARELDAVVAMKRSLNGRVPTIQPFVVPGGVALKTEVDTWLQAVGNKFLPYCRCKL